MTDPLRGAVLVTGAAGMLGSQLLLDAPDTVEAVGTDLVPAREGNPDVAQVGFDLADEAAVEKLLELRGDWAGILHAAAYTAVDKAEQEEELALRVNAEAPAVLARACARRRLPLVCVSTDFVFDGQSTRPYRESDPTAPLGVYGRTKFEGERRAREAWPETRVVRTQWLYGPRGNHFPGTMLRLAAEHERLKVVHDQVGSPTTTLELGPALWDVLRAGTAGVYHAACEGTASWFEFARETLALAGVETPIDPCTTAEFPRPAPRPAYSAMDSSKLALLRGGTLADWRQALEDFLAAEGLLAPDRSLRGARPNG